MKGEGISRTQLASLVWAGVLAPAAELLPGITLPAAGKGAWLAPLAALPLVLAGGWLLGRLGEGPGLAGRLAESGVGKAILILYMVWGELLLTLRLRLCARRLLDAGRRDGALWFFLLAVAAVVLWMGLGQLSAFARAGQFFLAILLTAGGVVLLLSLTQTRPERVLPLWVEDIPGVLSSALPAAGTLGWGLYGTFLLGETEGEDTRGRRHWLAWGVGGCLLLTLAQYVILASLGQELSGRLDNPFFTLAQSVGVEGAFQRVESVVTAIWTLADLAMAGVLLFSLRSMAAALRWREKRIAVLGLVLAAALALLFFSDRRAAAWGRTVVPFGNLILGLALPALMILPKEIAGKRRPGGTSCMGKGM